MTQEIITYLIIGITVTVAFYKIRKKLRKVNKAPIKRNKSVNAEHNCADCAAECMLRNSIKPTDDNNQNLCKKPKLPIVKGSLVF